MAATKWVIFTTISVVLVLFGTTILILVIAQNKGEYLLRYQNITIF